MKHKAVMGMLACMMGMGAQTAAAEPAVEFSGFLSVVGGLVTSDNASNATVAANCLCYVADFNNYGTYEKSFSLSPETRVGLQATAHLADRLQATVQITSRGVDPNPRLEWAYLSYAVTPDWDVQVGRKRIPLYYYSSFQDVGMAYPWVGPPPELYGWEVTNYNGVSVRNRTSIGDAYVSSSFFAGSERVKDGRFMLAYSQPHTDVAWNNLIGADIEVVRNNLTLRGVYLQADTSFADRDDPSLDWSERMQAYSIAANLDFKDWFVLSEWTSNVRDNKTGSIAGVVITIPAVSLGVGYRWGAWTSFLNFSQYSERSSDESVYAPSSFKQTSLVLRYDVNPQSAVKAQIVRHQEPLDTYERQLQALRISYERVF